MGHRVEVVIPYTPRPQFQPYHDSSKRFRVIVAHRRGGKTVATVNELIRSALLCDKPDPRVGYIAPFHKQAKDTAWLYVKRYTECIPGRTVNETELRVDLPNGGRVKLYGADNPDALRGVYFDDVALDEFADMRPRFLPEVLRPTLSDRFGRLTLIGTPKGRNEFFEAYEAAENSPEWFRLRLRASESGILDAKELDSARAMMSPSQYAQEYETSFEAAIEGAYYGVLLEEAERAGRIAPLPWHRELPVYTGWDLGIGDDTSIWFAQRVGGWLHIIDHYANNGEPASHYADVLRSKGYVYGEHYLPHDAESREWGNGLTRIDTLKKAGINGEKGTGRLRVLPRTPVDDGINAVRLTLPISRFDGEKCKGGLESLRQYRRDYDEHRRTFKPTPLHDWTSHDADGFRSLCMGLRPEAVSPPKPPAYGFRAPRRASGGGGWLAA